jgi:histidyl-tRNA synthetase
MVRRAFEEVARIHNFKIMEPASIERLETLRAKSGEEVDKEIYNFKDKAGREIGLRFDLTVGITRFICTQKGVRLPAKLASVGGVWRYDEPQYGRYRWSHQWDLEIFGPPSVEADAEIISAGAAILKRLGLTNTTIKVGDRRVVEEFIRTKVGISDEGKVLELMRALDKVEKKSLQELKREYAAKGFSDREFTKIADFGELRGPPDEVLSKASKLDLKSTEDLEALTDILRSQGVDNLEYNMSVVRGIDYYTGIVFEAMDKGNLRLGSLFGGGRYDSLPKLFGRPDLSATGAAGGIERMALSLSGRPRPPPLLVYVASVGEKARPGALRILRELRTEGIPSEASLSEKGLTKQLEDASRGGATWVVIVGEREIASGTVTLRDMSTREERQLPLGDAVRMMKQAGVEST